MMKRLLIIIILLGVIWQYKSEHDINVTNNQLIETAKPIEIQQKYSCDGRQYCSQMHSRAEALFFLKNCPNTKMDGDYDGIPCENDSRF